MHSPSIKTSRLSLCSRQASRVSADSLTLPVCEGVEKHAVLSADTRLAWREHNDSLDVFIDGECIAASSYALPYLMALCSGDSVEQQALDAACPILSDALSESQALVTDPSA